MGDGGSYGPIDRAKRGKFGRERPASVPVLHGGDWQADESRGGGRVSFCGVCVEQLERKGLLKRHEDGTVELIKPLLDVIGEF